MADNELKIAHPFEKPDFKIAVSLEDEHYCKVVCEPLERRFGLTLGNAMRRTLLTSLTELQSMQLKLKVLSMSSLL